MTNRPLEKLINARMVLIRPKLAIHAQELDDCAQSATVFAETRLKAALDLLNGVFPGRPSQMQSDIFREVTKFAALAFPDDAPTNVQILSNSATPDLMRYLLASIRRHCGDKKLQLDAAFLATNPVGAPGRFKQLEQKMLGAAVAAYDQHRQKQADSNGAYKAAREAAYALFRAGEPEGHDESARRKIKRKIDAFLKQQGFVNS